MRVEQKLQKLLALLEAGHLDVVANGSGIAITAGEHSLEFLYDEFRCLKEDLPAVQLVAFVVSAAE